MYPHAHRAAHIIAWRIVYASSARGNECDLLHVMQVEHGTAWYMYINVRARFARRIRAYDCVHILYAAYI